MKLLPIIWLVTIVLAISLPGANAKAEIIVDTDGDSVADILDACPTDVGPTNEDPQRNGCTSLVLARQWVVAFLVKHAPPGRPTWFEHAKETKEEALKRYNALATDLVSTVYDPDIRPLFSGSNGRSRTLAIVLGIMFWETGFRRDVDFGLGAHGRGDRGKSWCLMQLHIGVGRTAPWNWRLNRPAMPTDLLDDVQPGFSGPELVSNRKVCITEGLKVVRGSFAACKKLPLEHRLSAYASGSCDKGREKSKERVNTGIKWFSTSRSLRLFTDVDVSTEILVARNDIKEVAEPTPMVARR
jgi:hypothetical protein